MASKFEASGGNHTTGMASWTANMSDMVSEMDFVVGAKFKATSQGKITEISAWTVDVCVQNMIVTPARNNTRHELDVTIKRNGDNTIGGNEICSMQIIMEFLYPTHVNISTTIPKSQEGNVVQQTLFANMFQCMV